jgi:hypothetical protein
LAIGGIVSSQVKSINGTCRVKMKLIKRIPLYMAVKTGRANVMRLENAVAINTGNARVGKKIKTKRRLVCQIL